MLLGVEVDTVPILEDLEEALKVFLLETVEVDDFGGAFENLYFIALCCATPLSAGNVTAVEGPGVAAA